MPESPRTGVPILGRSGFWSRNLTERTGPSTFPSAVKLKQKDPTKSWSDFKKADPLQDPFFSTDFRLHQRLATESNPATPI